MPIVEVETVGTVVEGVPPVAVVYQLNVLPILPVADNVAIEF